MFSKAVKECTVQLAKTRRISSRTKVPTTRIFYRPSLLSLQTPVYINQTLKRSYHASSLRCEEEKDEAYWENALISEIANSIDTTLTPEQQEYVKTIKKKIHGGPNSRRSLYRDVPKPEEIEGMGNFMPRLADNAEALIDYALSRIPKRDGPRRNRRKKRMALKWATKRKYDAIKKEQKSQANLRRHKRFQRITQEIKNIKLEAQRINDARTTAKQ